MSKFSKKTRAEPTVSTASLPDIVFMLLFFFMVTTKLRETDLLVKNSLPQATQLEKLEQKSLISYIYIGPPKLERYGKEPRIQLNDVFATKDDIQKFVNEEKAKLDPSQRDKITISMKVDRSAKMGIITDVKLELREADARKLNYASNQRTSESK